jgi:phage virion morphogenesis protein
MGARIEWSIEWGGVKELFQDIAPKRLTDFTEPLKQAGIHMEKSVSKNFSSGGRPNNWRPLQPATLARRRKGGAGGRILQDSGQLKQSVTSNVDVKRLTKVQYEFGSSKKHAGVHQYGYKHIPARPYLLFQTEDTEAIERIFDDYVKGVFG